MRTPKHGSVLLHLPIIMKFCCERVYSQRLTARHKKVSLWSEFLVLLRSKLVLSMERHYNPANLQVSGQLTNPHGVRPLILLSSYIRLYQNKKDRNGIFYRKNISLAECQHAIWQSLSRVKASLAMSKLEKREHAQKRAQEKQVGKEGNRKRAKQPHI